MTISRRTFFASLAVPSVRRHSSTSLPVSVIEVFEHDGICDALLVHHTDPNTRQVFSDWLHMYSASNVEIQNASGQTVSGTMFRVRMCFGRGLIMVNGRFAVREHEMLKVYL